MVGNAFHDEGAAGLAGGHVIKIRIDANNGVVVRNIVVRVVRIGVLCLGRRHLVCYSGHCPCGAVVVMVVCINADVFSADIHCCGIINDLFIVSRYRILDILCDTGGKGRCAAGKDSIIIVAFLSLSAEGFLGQVVQIVCKRVAACCSEIIIAGKAPVCLQQDHAGVPFVCVIQRAADSFLGGAAAEPATQKINCPAGVRQRRGEIALHDAAELCAAARQLGQNIVGVQIPVDIQLAIGMSIRIINPQIALPDLLGHCFHVGAVQLALGVLHQVHQVAGPSAEVDIRLGVVIIVSNVYGTEHVGELCSLSIGQGKAADAAKGLSRCAVYLILLRNVSGKGRILRAGQDRPALGIVLFNPGPYVVYHKADGILPRRRSIAVCVSLKNLQTGKKFLVACHGSDLHCVVGVYLGADLGADFRVYRGQHSLVSQFLL